MDSKLDTSSPWMDRAAGSVFAFILLYWVYTVVLRLDYPYDLEWMEGGMLIHALRLSEGLGIYVVPSSDFIPYIYPPLYPTIIAALSEIWTLDYWMGRGISILGTVLATSALIVGVRRETRSFALAWMSGALWLSTYEDSGTFFDLTRADGLMMGLLGWCIVLVRFERLKTAGLLCWIAFLTKHNAAIVGIPIALWLWKNHDWRKALEFGLWSALPALMSIGWLEHSTDGLFLTYLLDVPANHPIVGHRLVWLSELEMLRPFALPLLVLSGIAGWHLYTRSTTRSIWRTVCWVIAVGGFVVMTQVDVSVFPKIVNSHKVGQIPFAIAIWVLAIVPWFRPSQWRGFWQRADEDSSLAFYLWIGTTLFLFSALMRGHHGGFTNVLMPGIWAMCVLVPLWIHRVGHFDTIVRSALWTFALGFQSIWGLWSIKDFVPSLEDRLAGDVVLTEFKNSQGPIWSPHSPWLSVQAGYPSTTHLIALWDIDHEGGPFVEYVADIKKDIQDHRWGTIVSADKRLGFGLKQYYEYHRSIRPAGRRFIPKIGWKVRPSYVYRPKTTPSTVQPTETKSLKKPIDN